MRGQYMKTVDRVNLIQIRAGEFLITIKKEQIISKYKQILNQLFDELFDTIGE